MSPHPKVVVVGAGAFGGWTALSLRLQGADVTLLDAWGPGHARASSGGETRIIRATYGPRRIYTRLAARALQLWRAHDDEWGHGCLTRSGAIWMSGADDQFGRDSFAALQAEGIPAEWLDATEAARRWPQVDFSGITSVLLEPEAGFLHARRACAAVVARFVSLGGAYRVATVAPPDDPGTVRLTDGSIVPADIVVYACGPWMGALFPSVIGPRISPTRQVVHYFGVPDGDRSFSTPHFPIWLELGDAVMYGFPADDAHGFKIADVETRFMWDTIRHLELTILVPHRPGRRTLANKEQQIRREHRIPRDLMIVFIEVELADASDFLNEPEMKIEQQEGRFIMRISRAASISHTLAAVALEMAKVGRPPEIHFGWTDESPVSGTIGFLLFGEGNVPWMVRDLIIRVEPDEAKRPLIIIAGSA